MKNNLRSILRRIESTQKNIRIGQAISEESVTNTVEYNRYLQLDYYLSTN